MSLTSQLKPIVDLPVFEWARFAPASTSASSAFTRDERYIYYIYTGAFWRYDTYNDSWQQLATPTLAVGALTDLTYSQDHGYYGRAISSGGGSNKIQLAGLVGNVLVGKKIRIISGTGAGQERTITAISAPTIHDRGVVTASSSTTLTDASTGVGLKAWKINQWRDYQVRLDYSAGVGGQTQCRPILNNSANAMNWYEASYAAFDPWWGRLINPVTNATAGTQTLYQIESQIATVDSSWDIIPNSTSKFVVMGGGIWAISTAAATNTYTFQYYDILADAWYYKSSQDDLLPAALGTDASIAALKEEASPLLSGTASAGAAKTLTDSTKSMSVDQYANFEIRITGGTGVGQIRTILSNSATVFYTTRSWDVNPDNSSTYAIYSDSGKFWLIGDGRSAMYQYSLDSDQFTLGNQLEHGCARIGSAKLSGQDGIAITSIAKTTGGVTALNATPTAGGTGYLAGQILTITTGGTGATARILTVTTAGAVSTVSLETCGSVYTTGGSKATSVNVVGGSGCTLNITTIGDIATVTTAINHNFEHSDSVTIAGASAANYNGAKTILGIPSSTTFQYVAPADAAPTFGAHSVTTLIDAQKNWATNEHVGKIVQITTSASPTNTSFSRRITANTSNTLTFATGTAPTNSTSRYVIHSIKAFGTEMSTCARIGGGRDGIATAGSATSLTDSTKYWAVNCWSNTLPSGASNTGRKVRIIAGTGVGQELTITSNDATTLNFATAATALDATSVYVIMDCFGIATSASNTTLTDTTQNWETNIWAGKRLRITSGTGYGGTTVPEVVITSNTQTTLTFGASQVTPDATSTYAIYEVPPRNVGNRIDIITGSTNTVLNGRYAYIWRGGATSELARYNINTDQHDLLTYFPITEVLGAGSMFAYDGDDRIYFTKDSTGRIMYYDLVKNITVPAGTIPYGMSTAIIGNRMEIFTTADGLKYLYIARHTSNELWRTLLFN
jgi:hypothetical protein